MKKDIKDLKLKIFMDFFESQGVKFVNHETGEEIIMEDEDEDKGQD